MAPEKLNYYDKIYQELKKIPYCDFHFHWEKDEWYPDGNFKHIGKRIRNPLELIFQDYGGGLFLSFEEFPFNTSWEFIDFSRKNEEEAYRVVQPLFRKVSHESKISATLEGFKILYRMVDLDLSNPTHYWELSKRVKEAYKNGILEWLPSAYEKSGIYKCMNIWTTRYAREHFDNLTGKEKEKERELLPPTFRFDYFLVLPFRYKETAGVAKWFWEAVQDINNLPVQRLKYPWKEGFLYYENIARYLKSISFDDYLKFVEKSFSFFAERGANYLKSACCYGRTLLFKERSEKEARKAFEKLKNEYVGSGRKTEEFEETIRIFEDFIFFRCLKIAKSYGWNTVQIHTGHKSKEEETARPSLLEEVIKKHPDINFILLHGGKYYYTDVIHLCRKYDNVIADFTWIPILAPSLAKKMVKEFLTEFPYRTVAGLDMANIEGCAGMAEINRRLISEVLSELIEEGKIKNIHQAIKIGENVINKKPKQLFPKSF